MKSFQIDSVKKNTKVSRAVIEADKAAIKEVLEYYHLHGRHDLIWRKKITPYKILVSEIMLQQTQVARVTPKFEEWMKKFPSLTILSESSLSEILILWQGLGYQRRAKALLAVAKQISTLPKSYEKLLALPGIGPYTAGALMAFAYDTFSHPVIETNIRTVLIDYFHPGETDIHDGLLYDDLSRLVTYQEVKDIGARHFYYALMDRGAHLKANKISHNSKCAHHTTQSRYEGSLRQLRAKTLFTITHREALPLDERLDVVVSQLIKEEYIVKKGKGYVIL